MYVKAPFLDELLHRVLNRLRRSGATNDASKGSTQEILAVTLELTNPLARLSRSERRSTLFSGLGELAWILSASDRLKPIEFYIPRYRKSSHDQKTIAGAYGPRLFGKHGQFERAIYLLRARPTTRRGMVQIFETQDSIENVDVDVPCTVAFQMLLRNKKLHWITTMRSNDAWYGLPHDVFVFTFLQELAARKLNVEVGRYVHCVGSLHIYEECFSDVDAYINEGLRRELPMPAMPAGNPDKAVKQFVKAERCIRNDGAALPSKHAYWSDLVRLLEYFRDTKKQEDPTPPKLNDAFYDAFLSARRRRLRGKKTIVRDPIQQVLDVFDFEEK